MASAGTIKRLVTGRGFGFIEADEQQEELFFHMSAVEGDTYDNLREGQRVTFERERDTRGRGFRAVHVRPA